MSSTPVAVALSPREGPPTCPLFGLQSTGSTSLHHRPLLARPQAIGGKTAVTALLHAQQLQRVTRHHLRPLVPLLHGGCRQLAT